MKANGRGSGKDYGELTFYERAAKILEALEQRKGSIKALTVGNSYLDLQEKKLMYALICQTLKYASVLTEIVEANSSVKSEKLGHRLELLLAHDLLFSKGGLRRKGANPKLNKAISRHQSSLKAQLNKLRADRNIESDEDLIPQHLQDEDAWTFRYARVNLLNTSMDKVKQHLSEDNYEEVAASREDMRSALPKRARKYAHDPDLEDVLVFPPGTELHKNRLYGTASIILQDKASCIPAHVLRPPPGSHVIDACAAPGNKTSHMASMMNNQGKIFAFDKDQKRLNTLISLTDKAKCKIIEATCADFLEIDPQDPTYGDVEYMLLDPSCSGSGIVNRMDALVDSYIAMVNSSDEKKPEVDKERLQSLAEFQTAVILHAMQFPKVKRISYSTCSVHEEENEAVVAQVLESQNTFTLAPADQLIPSWPRRGLQTAGLSAEQAACLVRTLPEDGTNGFFVACFVREASGSFDGLQKKRKEAQGTASVPVDANASNKKSKGKSKYGESRKRKKSAEEPEKSIKTREKQAKSPSKVTLSIKHKGKKRPKRKSSVVGA
ncbi:hypothetical protein IWW36_003136 [Coemansia brasiliensis]|uniref:SAM-dependent MTase RsmB/NOP-type domain-containing protein n=1 Tax=Coemansia brasiliensis TaxID=2650707 RepID=A0A9W8I8C6_9FUNG|nr:hypothetical protein IWW36_003136 [Coemansia brasiliensis]